MPEVLDPTVTSSHLPTLSLPLHTCLHPLPFPPSLHLVPPPPRLFLSQCLCNNCPHPQIAKPKRETGYQSPINLFSILVQPVPFPKGISLLSVEALTEALSYVHDKTFFLEFALISSGQPLRMSALKY